MIKPLPGYVLIEPIEEELKSGEVYLPENSKDKPMKGKVLDVTFYHKEDEEYRTWHEIMLTPVKEAQMTVTYKKWTNQEVQDEGKKYLLVKFDELLAVIE